MDILDHPILIFDGACGTNLQEMEITTEEWNGSEGCNEALNINAPHHIEKLHVDMLHAGAMVIETNTFGATSLTLAEYGLQDRTIEINRAAVQIARRAMTGYSDRYLVGSIGPGTKLPSLGQIDVSVLTEALREQISSLLDAGVDGLIIETCQDLLQVKTALRASFDEMAKKRVSLPVFVSVTIEQQGTMLVGSDIGAIVATLEPFPIASLGLNCATGPNDMVSHLNYLSEQWPGRISCIPNQGLPEIIDGETHYPLSPNEYAEQMAKFIEEKGISIVGGCCGTSPEHIQALYKRIAGITPKVRKVLT